jgi:hypothetical protein
MLGARVGWGECRCMIVYLPGCQEVFVWRWGFIKSSSGRGVKLTTQFQLVPRSRKCGSIRLHGVVFNYLSTEPTLPYLSSPFSGVLWLLSSPIGQLAQSHGFFPLAVNQDRTESSTTLLDERMFSYLRSHANIYYLINTSWCSNC